jgi:hypothetical protein
MLPRLIVRLTLLTILLHASGWATASALTWSVLIIPVVQTLLTMEVLKHPTSAHLQWFHPWRSRLQRVYQSLLVLLVLSALLQCLNHLHAAPGGLLSLVGLSVSALSPDDAAEIRLERDASQGYCITLRGTFQLLWEPRDRFEKWMLILFLRRLQRVGETRPFLRQHHITEAFGVDSPNISYWTREVDTYGWHVLSDRYRHQIHSALPDASLSRAILKVWVPTFAHVPSPLGWGGPVRG